MPWPSTLTRADLTDVDATEWLDPALRAFVEPARRKASRRRSPTPSAPCELSTCWSTTASALPGAQDLTRIPQRDQVKAKITEVIRMVTPYYL